MTEKTPAVPAATSFRDIPPLTLELAGRTETFRCPKTKVWMDTQILLYSRSGMDPSKLTKKQIGDMVTSVNRFFTASMGAEAFEAFDARFDDEDDDLDVQHVAFALQAVTEHFEPYVNAISAETGSMAEALWSAYKKTSDPK